MKRIVTHMLVAASLAAGACGVAQAHTDLSIGLSLGAPAYVAPAPVYAAPQPVYYGHPGWDQRNQYYRHDRDWNHGDRWNHGGPDHRDGRDSRDGRDGRGWGYHG